MMLTTRSKLTCIIVAYLVSVGRMCLFHEFMFVVLHRVSIHFGVLLSSFGEVIVS